MGERKVLNKHIPPDIDPLKIRKMRGRPNNQQKKIRNMLAMSIRCNTCGNYMSRGTKFNSRKEDAVGEKHLGTIQIYRFYIKCKHCSSEITFKTDPGNSDYAVETGATRNFEPWRAKDEEADKQKRKRETEKMGDAMKSLENRTRDSKRELDILAALDEIKSLKSRHAMVSVDAMLEALERRAAAEKGKKAEFEEDEAVIKAIFQSREVIVRRISDDELIDDDLESRANLKTRSVSQDNARISQQILWPKPVLLMVVKLMQRFATGPWLGSRSSKNLLAMNFRRHQERRKSRKRALGSNHFASMGVMMINE